MTRPLDAQVVELHATVMRLRAALVGKEGGEGGGGAGGGRTLAELSLAELEQRMRDAATRLLEGDATAEGNYEKKPSSSFRAIPLLAIVVVSCRYSQAVRHRAAASAAWEEVV